jgi:putative hydrolase of the HAD superfamily
MVIDHCLGGIGFMGNQQTLIMDLDDTLVHCNKYFKESKKKFVSQMQKWFKALSKKEIIQKHSEIDLKSVEKYGLQSSVYPDTYVETYKYFCKKFGRKMEEKEIKQVRRIGERVFQQKVQPLPYMKEVLNKLREDGHQLYLFTGGDLENQRRKIKQLDLGTYFENRVFIFEHKNINALKKVLKKIKPEMNSTWMIGNSLKTDIKPAIELGINAIHIPSEIEWSYNIVDIEVEPRGVFAELKSLLHLPDYLREFYERI